MNTKEMEGNGKMDFGESNRIYHKRIQHEIGMSLFKRIPKAKNEILQVLDVGCGMGEFIDRLSETGANVVGVDGSDRCVQYTKSHLASKHIYRVCDQIDLERSPLPYDDFTFDVVVSLEVIEHLENTEFYLSELYRVLKFGGYVIISTPNYDCVQYRIFPSRDARHKRFFTTMTAKKEISNFFKIKRIVGTPPFPIYARPIFSYGLKYLANQIGILGVKQ